ncbi:MAG: HD domain-containing protein [Anaerolineae bacterium]|jgi:tRNA nucleotidyltransferase/poly(A) polymerase|nr:HD domain-containing protein [Anaerolineae bacterium]MBT7069279.1 HD domain-containing protein [Anaerolineae bacterium]MBT7326005.1 HD domain-containing protein [Anaerolineae bacterium]
MTTQQPASGVEKGSAKSPYAGRWVARLRGKIIAHGGTPAQALHAAKQACPKEKPEITYMPSPETLVKSSLLPAIVDALPQDQPLYLIGGAVRDALLGQVSHDLDFGLPPRKGAVDNALKVARRIANKIGAAYYPLDSERGAARLVLIHEDGTRDILDFAAFRGDDLETDLRGRDFTLNAIALDVRTQQLFDPLNGANDLRAKTLRACSPTSLSDDPIRVLRAIRLAASYGFRILPETRQAMKAAIPALSKTSAERRRDELFRILEGKQPATAIRALEMLGVLPEVFPELPALKDVAQPSPHVDDVWAHTLNTLRHLENILSALSPEYDSSKASEFYNGLLVLRLGRYREQFDAHFADGLTADRSIFGLLFFAALYHDVAKPLKSETGEDGRIRFWGHDAEGAEMAADRMRSLHLSNDETDRVKRVIGNHMRIHSMTNRFLDERKQPSRRAIYRFFRDTREAGVDLVLLSLADLRATYEHTLPESLWKAELDVCRILLENLWEHPAEVVKPPSFLNGHEVMQAFELSPSPLVGALLEAIREAQAMGDVSDKDEALVFASNWLKKEN